MAKQKIEFAILRTIYSAVARKEVTEVVYHATTETMADISIAFDEQRRKWPVNDELSLYFKIMSR